MSTLTPPQPHPPASPGRAGSLRQVLQQRWLAAWAPVWKALQAAAQVRAAPHLLAQARRLQSDQPELAAALRALALDA